MIDVDQNLLEEFVAACRNAATYSLMRCSSGNMSLRIDDNRMLVSASRSWMSHLTTEQVAECAINGAELIQGPRPSVETVFHAGILRHRRDINVVLHFQSNAATTLACCDELPNYNIIPEIPYYIGPVGYVEYLPPGSHDLASRVIEVMKQCDLAQLANHGQVVVGRDFADAIQKAVFFELACEIILRAGDQAVFMPVSATEALRQAAGNNGKV